MIVAWAGPHPSAADDADRSEALRLAVHAGIARNVILFLGDGLGDSEITIARNYAVGAAGRLAMDSLPFTGTYTTYSVQEADPTLPEYVADSAATGTAWSTGVKTSNGRISTAPSTGRELPTILEMAQQRGRRQPDDGGAHRSHAGRVGVTRHQPDVPGPRRYGRMPARESAGGLGSIAEQEIDHGIDVLFGGGYGRFEQPTDAGPMVLQRAMAAGYRIITAAAGLEYVRPGTRVLGLFASGNMTTEWNGAEALPYPSNVKTPQICDEQHHPSHEPSLAEMTAAKAIELLDRSDRALPGFFLQVEGASSDKQDHSANACGQIGETIAFDHAGRASGVNGVLRTG